MSKFQELKDSKIYTVGELIEKLKNLPKETKLNVTDSDLGGYDSISRNYCVLDYSKENNDIIFKLLDYDAWELKGKGELSDEEYNLLCPD